LLNRKDQHPIERFPELLTVIERFPELLTVVAAGLAVTSRVKRLRQVVWT
jgi:hypothetical protein